MTAIKDYLNSNGNLLLKQHYYLSHCNQSVLWSLKRYKLLIPTVIIHTKLVSF